MDNQTINLFTNQDSSKHSNLVGQIQRVTYSDPDTGYTVAKVMVDGFGDPITIVGNLGALSPGERLSIEGNWEVHPKFGRQFKVKAFKMVLPSTSEAIEKYLGSGLIKGIGPVTAKRIVDRFGDQALEIIDKKIHELEKVEGLGKKKIKMIEEAWKQQKEVSSIMVFLKSHGVGPSLTTKIFQKYGHQAISIISENPYRLAEEIHGVGFATADRLAASMGLQKESPQRIESGILFVLGQMSEQGHVYYPYEELIKKCTAMLQVDREVVVQGIARAALRGKIILEDLNEDLEKFSENFKAVYLQRLYNAESNVAKRIKLLLTSRAGGRQINGDKAIQWVQRKIAIRLTHDQLKAVEKSLKEKMLVITGGPGTGKTTIIRAIIEIYKAAGFTIALAAPTGRAAKRMQESTGREAKTVHRLLEFNWQRGGFQRNENRPLEADIIIIDEFSMMDISLTNRLFKAIKPDARVIVVGDADQLPSVGPGNVLRDLIKSQVLPVVKLNQIFRQAEESLIVLNAHRINKGLGPILPEKNSKKADFYFIEEEGTSRVFETIMELVAKRIPRSFNLNPITEIQVLSPMHKGPLGTENLNRGLQDVINPSSKGLKVGTREFRLGDKVMQIRNDYEKEVFNGDVGVVESISENQITICFDDRKVLYYVHELDDLVHAYAISVHKSQGSEYKAVVFPVLPEHYLLLQRNLIYTGVTRARALLIIIGSKRALVSAIRNDKTARRYTYLAARLREF